MSQPVILEQPAHQTARSATRPNTPYRLELVRRNEPRWMGYLAYPYLAIALTYLVWRSTVIAWDVWYGPVTYLAELFNLVSTVMFVVIAREIHDPVFRPTALAKTVDVFIATYTEPLEVLEPVVIGAMRVRGKRNVLILDDGNRPEVEAMAKRHGAIWIPRTTNEHAKAGNLNHGLLHTDAEFILELDADHVPLPWFLERTLGYFDDPELAFVQAPQTFYNRDTFLFRHNRETSGFWFEQRMFYDAIQPAKNKWNAAFFVGTSRASAPMRDRFDRRVRHRDGDRGHPYGRAVARPRLEVGVRAGSPGVRPRSGELQGVLQAAPALGRGLARPPDALVRFASRGQGLHARPARQLPVFHDRPFPGRAEAVPVRPADRVPRHAAIAVHQQHARERRLLRHLHLSVGARDHRLRAGHLSPFAHRSL